MICAIVDSLLVIVVLISSFSLRIGYFYLPENNLMLLFYAAPIIALPIFFTGDTSWWPTTTNINILGTVFFLYIVLSLYKTTKNNY